MQRSDAVLFLLRRRTFEEGFVALAPGNPPSILGYLNPPDPTLAEDLARATGGDVRSGEGSGVGAFRQIFDDFRQRYLLHYQPAGVPPDGWHDVSVRVIRPGKFQVSARKGYMAGGGSPGPTDRTFDFLNRKKTGIPASSSAPPTADRSGAARMVLKTTTSATRTKNAGSHG